MVAFPGGAGLGTARGKIELDISQLQLAAQQAAALGRTFQNALGGIDSAAKRSRSSFQGISEGIGKVRTELTALSVGSGLLAGFGLAGAKNLRNYTVAFRQFVGTQKEAEEITERLIKQANRYGLEWEGVAQLGRALLPSLEGGTKELDGWISRAARLRSLFPTAPRGSETIAISEFLAGQNMSLSRRFNVPLATITEATSKFKDLGEQFDYILERRGATEEAAMAMADAFVGVRNELGLLLAEGFTPLFQQLQPLLAGFREWVSALRESNPEVATGAAGLIALTAAGAPALLLFNQLVIAAKSLKTLGVLGALGKGGLLAGAAVGGGMAGLGISRAIGRATGNERMANETWATLWETVKKIGFILNWGMGQILNTFQQAAAYVADQWYRMTASMLEGTAGFLHGLAALVPDGVGGKAIAGAANALSAGAVAQRGRGQAALAGAETYTREMNDYYRQLIKKLRVSEAVANEAAGRSGGGGTGGAVAPADAVHQWAISVKRIEADAAAARLDATEQYEQQRAETIAVYELGIARDAEDFARSRARAASQLNRQIADIRADGAKREADWAAEVSERIADARAESNERIAEIERTYQRDRERAATDHRDKLLSAAGRLDAVAVREEQRRYARQESDAAEAFDERVSKEQASIQERIAQEEEGHRERLENARRADEERIADMIANQAEQQRLEDEDRAIRLQRQAEDHRRQLQQQDMANAERLAQISEQAARERAQLDEAFMMELDAAGVHNKQWLALQKARQDASMVLYNEWWDGINKQFRAQGPATTQGPMPNSGFLSGFNLPPSFYTTPDFSGGSTGPFTSFPSSFSEAGARTSGRTVNFGEGSIVVNGTASMDETALARQVRAEMVAALEEIR